MKKYPLLSSVKSATPKKLGVKSPKKNRIILIRWHDPKLVGGGWLDKANVKRQKPCICSCIGYVVKEDDEVLIIAGAKYEDDYAQVIVIPKSCIEGDVEELR